MDKISFFAELLYIISNYEKGRIKINTIWAKKYVNSLNDSIDIMTQIIKLMKQNKAVENDELQAIVNFIVKNNNMIFPCVHNEQISETNITTKLFENSNNDKFLEYELIDLMDNILYKCNELLSNKERNYKKKISYLFMALHNIPRVYLNNENPSFFNIRVIPLNRNDARESAHYYMRLSEKA